ncbi:hypothetical protein Kisp01_28740 [Kineosporia sp. NBRC 101677]|uniref:hypothetical protein n=1 Tax=Kineosporia sp. NBRC 101677 TaxID=3032197 RepID=UPI0024A4FD6C|nr:hypothetical protein [Kineosporia sp. NBRC 101677]GLY15859.1 hypothetical protein Kisp01_28740 [Kineosporia sp. NBRC 101677]
MRRDPALDRPVGSSPRVLQIPGDHPYVHQVCPSPFRFEGSPGAVPSPALTPQWLSQHRGEFDVVHLHFGYEHLDVDEMRHWIMHLGRLRVPLVLTVHDLRNPHQDTPEAHDRHLDLLVPAAAVVLTLTAGAAAEIRRRWGRRAQVVPHPAIFDRSLLSRRPAPGPQKIVGIHLKDLRRNVVGPDQVVRAALSGAQAAGARLRIDLHPGVRNRPELQLTRSLAEQGLLDLVVHERFSDADLAGYLKGLHTYVLPNRFGTHSGWLEACRDTGTRIVAPSCGYYADQWDEVLTYQHDEVTGLSAASLTRAVRRSLEAGPVQPATPGFRAAQLQQVQAQHADVYRRAHRRKTLPVRAVALRQTVGAAG